MRRSPLLQVVSFTWLIVLGLSLSCCGQKTLPSDIDLTEVVFPKTNSIAEVLSSNEHLPIQKRISLYHKLRAERPEDFNFQNEDEMTMYGYRKLWNDLPEEALEVFKLLVEVFPNSANTYDSLGEAYLALGEQEKSLENYRKSLAMNPENFNAEDFIQRILHPDVVPETDAEKFTKTYSVDEYRSDLDQLAKRLLSVHPNALKFISAADFAALVEHKKSLVTDSMTYATFRWHCAEIIASVNCSHTSMGRFSTESDMLPVNLRFPVQTRLVDGQLFVIDPLENGDRLAVKDEILTINGYPVSEVIAMIYRRIPSQGFVETTKREEFNFWGTGMIPFALNFPDQYEVSIKGRTSPVQLQPSETVSNHFGNPAIKSCGGPLCYEVLDDGKTAVLTILSFNFYPWDNLDVFMAYMDTTFAKIEAAGIEHLIIDLRYNGGGSSESSIYLLRYLHDAPFTYFSVAGSVDNQEKTFGEHKQHPFENAYKGKLYFLIDGLGNSTTGHFMSLAKVWNMGTIIGEELGSNQFCSAGQAVSRLANTKMMYYVANNTHVTTATSLPDETGILPDHFVTQSIDDYLNKVDTVMEFAIGLTRKD